MSIERLPIPVLVKRNGPTVLATKQVSLTCGCRCLLGTAAPDLESPVLSPVPCSEAHLPLTACFERLWEQTTVEDGWVDIQVDVLLRKAETEYRARELEERKVGA